MVETRKIILSMLTLFTIVLFAIAIGGNYWTKLEVKLDGNYVYLYLFIIYL